MFSDEEMDNGDDDDSDSDVDQAEDDPEARQAAMDNLVPKLDPSEYGKMPASFHSNSQRVAPSTADNENDSEKMKTNGEGSSKPAQQPILPRDTYDGVDSDDETDEENLD